jgi:aminoglycoside 3-N-acetyltransferase
MSLLRREIHAMKRRWARWSAPRLESADIARALAGLQGRSSDLLLVHSSLSACGHIAGGPAAVIGALRAWHRDGTLLMPTHTYCYPRAGETAPVFDPAQSPSVVGAITDAFWRVPGVKRSLHPTHSLAADGPAAGSLVEGHETCATPCGAGTPYEKLVELDASVLMFGATLDAYTLFHTAEDAARVAYLYEPQQVPLSYRDSRGQVQPMLMWRHDMSIRRAFQQKDADLESLGLLVRVTLGRGELLLIPHARAAHAAVVRALAEDPMFLRAA